MTKNDLYQSITDYLNLHHAQVTLDSRGRELLNHCLNALAPKTTGKRKTKMIWLKLALAKQNFRPYLLNYSSQQNVLVACDGHRLHITKNDKGLNEGQYNKHDVAVSAEKAGEWPDYKRIVPSKFLKACHGDYEILDKNNFGEPELCGKKEWNIVINDTHYDHKMIQDALGGREIEECEIKQYSDNKILQIEHDLGVAIIYPKK